MDEEVRIIPSLLFFWAFFRVGIIGDEIEDGERSSCGVITLLSLGVALASTLIGLALSNTADVPPGPAIVLTAFALFVAAYLLRRQRDQRHSHAHHHHTHEHAA